MQKITIEVKDTYTANILEMLHSLKGVMIDKINLDEVDEKGVDTDFMKLQIDSMKETWNNQEDEAWDSQ